MIQTEASVTTAFCGEVLIQFPKPPTREQTRIVMQQTIRMLNIRAIRCRPRGFVLELAHGVDGRAIATTISNALKESP